jgi:hypothetical protein
MNYLPRLALNLDPPDLCLLSSWDYRREPPASSFSGVLVEDKRETHVSASFHLALIIDFIPHCVLAEQLSAFLIGIPRRDLIKALRWKPEVCSMNLG